MPLSGVGQKALLSHAKFIFTIMESANFQSSYDKAPITGYSTSTTLGLAATNNKFLRFFHIRVFFHTHATRYEAKSF